MTVNLQSDRIRVERAKLAVSHAVSDFEAREISLSALNDFETIFSASDNESLADIDASIAPFVKRLRTIAKNTIFLDRILCTKVRLIASGAKAAIESDNLLVLSYCTRALFEHCAAVVWVADKVFEFAQSLENKSNPKRLDECFKRVEGYLQALYYNKDRAPGFVHIHSMRKSLALRVADEEQVYARLCDYLHPNYGSNLIVSAGEIGAGVISTDVLWRADEAVYLASIAIMSIEEIAETIEQIHGEVLKFVGLMSLAKRPGVSIANWCSVRVAKPQGDGKTKGSALFFPKARTKIEAMRMFYEYLNDQEIEVRSVSVEAIEADWIFDKADTTCGFIWFRSPSALEPIVK